MIHTMTQNMPTPDLEQTAVQSPGVVMPDLEQTAAESQRLQGEAAEETVPYVLEARE